MVLGPSIIIITTFIFQRNLVEGRGAILKNVGPVDPSLHDRTFTSLGPSPSLCREGLGPRLQGGTRAETTGRVWGRD